MPTAAASIILKLLLHRGQDCKYLLARIPSQMLRHSFATHLIDQHINSRQMQVLLGPSSIKTTAIYTRVNTKSLRNIKSPMGAIMEDKDLKNNNLKN